MNNQELELKIKEILSVENYFDMVIELVQFEKEYKASDFFKLTKKSLSDVVKEARFWYIFDGLEDKIQSLISKLNFDNISEILDQLGDIYAQENAETLGVFKEFKDLVK